MQGTPKLLKGRSGQEPVPFQIALGRCHCGYFDLVTPHQGYGSLFVHTAFIPIDRELGIRLTLSTQNPDLNNPEGNIPGEC